MRPSLSLCALLLLAGVCGTAEEKPTSIAGRVIDSLTAAPVLRARISLRGMVDGKAQNFGSMTDAEGKFAIASLPAGSYSLLVERIGYGIPNPLIQVVLKPGDDKANLEVKLIPNGAITGRVVDAHGEPVESAWVRVDGGSGSTDENGRFRVGGLRPGKYRIKAEPRRTTGPPEIRSDGTTEEHYAGTWYPNSLQEEGAGRVEVAAGGETGGIEIQLARAPNVRVSGTVTGAPAGAEGVQIQIHQGYTIRSVARAGRDGSFSIWGLDPGKYRLRAIGGGRGGTLQSAAVEVEVGGIHVENVDLALVASIDLSGRVEFEGERPDTGQRPRPFQIALREEGAPGMGTRPAVAAPDGSFTLEQVPPGRYRVGMGNTGIYVKTVRLGENEVPDGILDLRNGAAGAALTLVARAATGEVSGTVRDAKGPAEGARVVLVGQQPALSATGPGGTFAFRGVAPGKYKLAAVDDGDLRDAMQGRLEAYKDVTEEFEIRDGEKLSKELKRRREQ